MIFVGSQNLSATKEAQPKAAPLLFQPHFHSRQKELRDPPKFVI
jgi:hypothetical protein